MSENKRTREVFQLTSGDYCEALPIPGSPAWMIRRFYRCEDAPTGYYATGEPGYIVARSAYAAVNEYLSR